MDRDDLRRLIRNWQKPLMGAYERGYSIRFLRRAPGLYSAHVLSPPGRPGGGPTLMADRGILPRVQAIVVGLDIREYSRRSPDQQFFLTLWLYSAIDKALRLLREAAFLPPEEPPIIVQTGDGAYLVFTFLEAWNPFNHCREASERLALEQRADAADLGRAWQARRRDPSWAALGREGRAWAKAEHEHSVENSLAAAASKAYAGLAQRKRDAELPFVPVVASRAFGFVFALNSIVEADNARKGFLLDDGDDEETEFPTFPVKIRFALSCDDVLLMEDVNQTLNCEGNGMVTCGRIVKSDHGDHLLVHDRLLSDLDRWGGVNRVADGQWGQRLHHTMLAEAKIKTATYQYADVFGFYHDGPLCRGLGRDPRTPQTYHIGSHNVRSIELG